MAGQSYNWKQLLANKLLDTNNAEQVDLPVDEALPGKHVALYFSAHWCPPCRGFTPQLANIYSKLKKDGKEFEVVFVSMDRNQHEFNEYFATMPWLAVPFQDDQLRSVLSRKFKVNGIPHLVVLGPDGTVVSSNARSAVVTDPNGDKFPWAGASDQRGPPIPWLLVAILLFWLINTYIFPLKPKS
eukprot:GHRR01006891.1.p1 GENE.GHRR01006891.1~~GHRR01006891.1.p1  ORF type:complete len:208 (+),score=49.63 GHRR01006891.1:71-625(+)